MAKIKKIQLKSLVLSSITKVKRQWFKNIARSGFVSEIIALIKKGISPVGKEGRFKRYSISYRDAIKKQGPSLKGKKVSPVNMIKSGKMLDSITFNAQSGKLSSDSELIRYHTEGKGNLPIRKLLPYEKGQEFSRRLNQNLVENLNKAIGKELKGIKRLIKISIK